MKKTLFHVTLLSLALAGCSNAPTSLDATGAEGPSTKADKTSQTPARTLTDACRAKVDAAFAELTGDAHAELTIESIALLYGQSDAEVRTTYGDVALIRAMNPETGDAYEYLLTTDRLNDGAVDDEYCMISLLTQTTEDSKSSPGAARLPNDVCLERIDEAVLQAARNYIGLEGEEELIGSIAGHHALYGDSDDQASHAIIVSVSEQTEPMHVAVVYEAEDCVIEYSAVVADGLLPNLEE